MNVTNDEKKERKKSFRFQLSQGPFPITVNFHVDCWKWRCTINRKNDLSQLFFFWLMYEKSVHNFNVCLYIYWRENGCHQPNITKDAKFACFFRQSSLWLIGSVPKQCFGIITLSNADWWFRISFLVVSNVIGGFSECKSHLLQPVSDSSVKTWIPVSDLFFIYFDVHYFFSRHIALSFVSWFFDILLGLPVCLPFTT